MDLAVQDVRRHLGKFAATIVGVALLQAIVFTMNGIYRGNIADGVWLIEEVDADLWVVERGRGGPFNEPSRIPEDTWRRVAAVPGVDRAGPFIAYTVERLVAGRSQQFTIIGYDVRGGLGAPRSIVEGRPIRQAHDETVADAKLGVAVGEQMRLGDETLTVVGLTRRAVDAGGNPLLYLSIADAQAVLYQQDDEAFRRQRTAAARSFEAQGFSPDRADELAAAVSPDTHTISAVLVDLEPGAEVAGVARHVREWLYLEAFTTAAERQLMIKGRLERMSAMLGLFRMLLVLVSLVIIALIVYVLTMDKMRVIATLKLIGAPNRVIVRMVLEQSLLLTVAGLGLGYLLVALSRDRFPRTLTLLTSDTTTTFAVMLAGGALASLFGIWRALRTPPSLALGG